MDATFHESDERLELYALDRLSGSEIIQIEEHLMICDLCREKLDETAAFAFCAREELRGRSASVSVGGSSWVEWLRGSWLGVGWLNEGWMKPGFALGGAMAAVLATVILFHGGATRLAPVASLQLTAMRGNELAVVNAAQELDLTFDDAREGNAGLSGELVDSSGASVWQGKAEAEGQAVRMKIRKAVGPGQYFARLYDAPGHLLHEYALVVKN